MAGFVFSARLLSAETIQCDGVLGNSGEQGKSLVRFGLPPVGGLGVVYDSTGCLWDRAGTGVLNRYSVDGRQLATYVLPKDPFQIQKDVITLVNPETIMLRLGTAGLYVLPVNAPSGSEVKPLSVQATRLSLTSYNGWTVAANGPEVFMVNATGEKKPVATLEKEPDYVVLGPDGTVYVAYLTIAKVFRVDPSAPKSLVELGPLPGERLQLLNGYWFSHRFYGTVRRFNLALEPSPGVVLGGASGSFIGHMDKYPEQDQGCGLAMLSPELFAVSGRYGTLHLLKWEEGKSQFSIVRRIGSLYSCGALGLDRKGDVWHYAGNWKWEDGPAAPLRNGVPAPDSLPPVAGAVMLPNDVMVAYSTLYGRIAFVSGAIDKEVTTVRMDTPVAALPSKNVVAVAAINHQKKTALLILQADGQGQIVFIDAAGKFQSVGGAVTLTTASPVTAWTSLISTGPDTLLGAADGSVIELTRDGDNWKESKRWSSWGATEADHFGARIFLSADEGRLWVSDTARQRVVCFDLATGKSLAVFGTVDKAGDSLEGLSAPQVIVARAQRAVVYDSGNQRLMKLELVAGK